MKELLCLFTLLFLACNAVAQLINPSFEDTPQDARVPSGWNPCSYNTTPDILPGFWGVTMPAHHGDTYMGLIVRPDGSWESVGQRLKEPLKKGHCYKLKLFIAHSPVYAGFNEPVRLRIWGSTKACERDDLLVKTKPIEHFIWKEHEFEFVPKKKISYLILEAWFISEDIKFGRGNILLDGFESPIECPRA